MKAIFTSLLLCLLASPLLASQVTAGLNPAQEDRYHSLIAELRCLVCQNQNIADSNAPLAEDLREQVLNMIQQGKSDAEIKAYLVQRYGDFVLYQPPLKPTTWLLWGGPFALLLVGLVIAWRILSGRRHGENEVTPDADDIKRALHEDESS